MKKSELVQQLMTEANQAHPDFQECMHLLQNLKVSATGKDRANLAQVINQLLNKAFALKDKNSSNIHDHNHAYEVTFSLISIIIEKHDYALFSKHWVNYFAQRYSPRYDAKAKWGSPNLIDELHLQHSPIIKALDNGWPDIAEMLLPMFNQMCRESRGNHIPVFIEKEYLKGIQWYYSHFTTEELAPSYYNKGKVLMDAINKGNWDIFIEIIEHDEFKNVSHSAFFPGQGYPSAWAMRANRMDMLKYMVDNNHRLHVLYENEENCELHPLAEAAVVGQKDFFEYLLNHYTYVPEGEKYLRLKNKQKEMGMVGYVAIVLAQNNNVELLDYMIKQGYDYHQNEDLVFTYACRDGKESTMQYLYDLGVDVHACNDRAFWWSLNESLSGVKFLEKHGVNTDEMLVEIISTMINTRVNDENLDYFLKRASEKDLADAMKSAQADQRKNGVYVDSGTIKRNKALVRNYLLNLKLSALPEPVSDNSSAINKI